MPLPRTSFYICFFLYPPSFFRRLFLVVLEKDCVSSCKKRKQSHRVRLVLLTVLHSEQDKKKKTKRKKTQGGKCGMDVEIQRREQTLLGSDPSTSSLIAVTVLEEALSEGRQHVFDPSRVAAPTRLNKTSCHYSEEQATAYIVRGICTNGNRSVVSLTAST